MRKTSIEVYRQIKAEGLLSKRRFQAYDILFHHGPLTGNEVCEKAGIIGLWKRLSELERLGVIETSELVKVCTVTGRVAVVWDVTGRLPEGEIAVPGKATESKALRRRIQALEEENARLKAQLKRWGRPKKGSGPADGQEPLL